MKKDRISRFDIAICKSEKHDVQFGIIAPELMTDVDESDITIKTQALIDFHIAIKPNVPVVLFDIENTREVGSPIWNIDSETRLYHIPEESYPHLDEFVQETAFLVTQDILTKLFDKQKLFSSIFSALPIIREEQGLVVLGLYHENTETQV